LRLREAFNQQVHLNIWGDGSAAGWVEMSTYDEASELIDEDALEGMSCDFGRPDR
jgi:hypothetical protein